MACCPADLILCAPDGTVVVALVDTVAGTSTYFNVDGTAWAGDPTSLDSCSGGSDSLVDNSDGTYTHTAVDGTVVTIDTCCNESSQLCAPDGTSVLVVINTITGVATYFDASNGSVWTGDPTTLDSCSAGGDPEVGQAVVVDNTDGTTTITGTDIAGVVTTDDVINNLLVNNGDVGVSRDIAPATDILLHDGNVENAAAFTADWPNCDPTPVYKNAAGELHVAKLCSKGAYVQGAFNQSTYDIAAYSAAVAGGPNVYQDIGPEITYSYTNNDCQPQRIVPFTNLRHWDARMFRAAGGWVNLQGGLFLSLNAGAYQEQSHVTTAIKPGEVWEHEDYFNFGLAPSFTAQICLAPGESATWAVQFRTRYFNNLPDVLTLQIATDLNLLIQTNCEDC